MSEFAKKNRRLIQSGGIFLLCYFGMLFIVFLMMIINDVHGWHLYIRNNFSSILSLLVSVFFLFGIIYFYYFFEDRSFLLKTRNVLLIFSLIYVSVIICYIFGRFIHLYARPFAMFALLVLFLLNRRQALFLNFIFAFLLFVIDLFTNNYAVASVNDEIYSSLMLSFVSGTFAVFLAGETKTRGALLLTGVMITIPSLIVVLLFKIPEIATDWIDYVSAAGFRVLGCVLASVLTLAFLPVFETLFNRLTVFRLRELTSTNAPLLVRLNKEAPGTFNHSLIVAQLAETCAVAIGENAELARAAAYYHDVGKLRQPDCFTENQTGYNLHDEITPELSADIIRSHTRDGYDFLVQSRMPQIIADVAREHHGTLPIKYFYNKAIKYSGDADLKDFSYLGPIPQTKIAAIVMISDAAEAATRAAADRSPEKVERTCRAIIEERMDLGQFDECDITMRELTVIKSTLVEALSGIHHHRVEYPAIRFNREKKAVKTEKKEE